MAGTPDIVISSVSPDPHYRLIGKFLFALKLNERADSENVEMLLEITS